MAVKDGKLKCINSLITTHPNIITKNINGNSAAHLAARNGYCDILEKLIRYDFECLQLANHKGWLPLHVAARFGHGNCVILLLRYGADISSQVTIDKTKKSALDLIVDYVPMAKEKFVELFDKYITQINNRKHDDVHCTVEIDYSLIIGAMPVRIRNYSSESYPPRDYTQEELIMNRKGRQMQFLKTLISCSNGDLIETLMLHPLIESFLYFKWKNLKYFFIIILFFYSIYTSALVIFSLLNYLWQIPHINSFFRILIFIMLVPLALTEIIQATALPYHYFSDIESWLKLFLLLTGILVVVTSSDATASRYLVSLSVLNSWIVMLFLLARFPAWGLHVLMFEKVSYNVFEVLSRFIFLFIGFLFAFMIHFEGDPPFGNFWESLCKVLIMLVELDYSGVFEEGGEINLHTVVGRLMFISFALLVAMVMVNLIVGMSVSDVAQLEMQGRRECLSKQTSFLISLELIVYNDWFVKCVPCCLKNSVNKYRKIQTKMIVHPDDPLCPFSSQCKDALLRHGSTGRTPTIEHCLEQIENLKEEVQELKGLIIKLINK